MDVIVSDKDIILKWFIELTKIDGRNLTSLLYKLNITFTKDHFYTNSKKYKHNRKTPSFSKVLRKNVIIFIKVSSTQYS